MDLVSTITVGKRAAKTVKCQCGCGQAPAATTRLRKASCGCGESIIRLSRSALSIVTASCGTCGGELSPDCLFDRTCSHDTADADAAIATLEARHDRALERREPKSQGRRANMFRCGDCQAIRSADAAKPCGKCGSTHSPTTSYMHPRAARAAGGDMPF